MDSKLVSRQPRELQHLAQKYGVSVERVKEVIRQTGRSRKQVEAELARNPTTEFFEKSE
jgi:uncharacterized protein YjcR